jgi:hypothetical protein
VAFRAARGETMMARSDLAAGDEIRADVIGQSIKHVKTNDVGPTTHQMDELERINVNPASFEARPPLDLGSPEELPRFARTERTAGPTLNLSEPREVRHAHPPVRAQLHRWQATFGDKRPHPLMVDAKLVGSF